jgi:hypothetical protein
MTIDNPASKPASERSGPAGPQTFSYGRAWEKWLLVIFGTFLLPFSLLAVFSATLLLLVHLMVPRIPPLQESLVWIGALFLVLINFNWLFPRVNSASNVKVTPHGLRVQVYAWFFYWRSVPWSEILDVADTSKFDRRGARIQVIKVRRLSRWHRQLSLFYNTGSQPVIVLTSEMQGREQLVALVREHL